MSYMKEAAMIIEEASAHGVELTLDDFTREGNALMIDGMDASEWVALMYEVEPDTLSDYA